VGNERSVTPLPVAIDSPRAAPYRASHNVLMGAT
jgi:hypothetical protein